MAFFTFEAPTEDDSPPLFSMAPPMSFPLFSVASLAFSVRTRTVQDSKWNKVLSVVDFPLQAGLVRSSSLVG